MKYNKHLLVALGVLSIGMTQSCTMAIIDEPDGSNLPPIQEVVKYNPDIQNVMFNSCTTCHGGPSPSAGLDLTTYQNVRFSAEQGNLVSRVNSVTNPMPPNGLISADARQKIDKWVQDGFPEN